MECTALWKVLYNFSGFAATESPLPDSALVVAILGVSAIPGPFAQGCKMTNTAAIVSLFS